MYVTQPPIGPASALLIMETRTCPTCNGSTVSETLTRCPNYDQPTYGRPCPTPGCGSRNRFSHRYTGSVRRPCSHCNATGKIPETLYDTIPDTLWSELPMRVYDRATLPLTWIEAYIGAGVYSVVDYGAHSKLTDAELIAHVRKSTYHQAIMLAKPIPHDPNDPNDRERGILCNHIAIIRRRDGYTVEAAFAANVDAAQVGREPIPTA